MPSSDRVWFPLYHRHGPCSPSQSTGIRSAAEMLRLGASAAGEIIQPPSGDVVTLPTTLGTSLNTLEYVVTVGLGTPAVTQTLLIDSGSSLSYVQCRPCPVPPCHRQKDAFFDPRKSSTYFSFSCSSTACMQLRADSNYNGCSSNSHCQYVLQYAGGPNITGTYSSDTLTLSSSSVVKNFRFGCSHFAQGVKDQTDGLMGLGRGAQSLVSQIGKKAFSYCLPPATSSIGFLTLGVPRISSSRFAVTPLYTFPNDPMSYVVILQGITVAGRRLDVPPSVFSAGSIMDSGTIITTLPPTAYRVLRAAFKQEMKTYPPAPPMENLDTCFNLSGISHVKVPRVALVFDQGAVMELHPMGIMQQDCLAFASTGANDSMPGIIGNVQQRRFEVLYDVSARVVGFRRGAC